jgi:hypothetical protein
MSDLTDALDRLIDEHRRVGSPVAEFLRPGLDPGEGRSRLAQLGLDARDELVDLYAWRDGSDEDAYRSTGAGIGYPRFFADVFFGSLSLAINLYRESLEIDRNLVATVGDEDAAIWNPAWFPPFSGGTPVYAVDCGPSTPGAGLVYEVYWHPPNESIQPRFRDLLHLVESVIRRFEAGGYAWDRERRFLVGRDEVLSPLYDREIEEARA